MDRSVGRSMGLFDSQGEKANAKPFVWMALCDGMSSLSLLTDETVCVCWGVFRYFGRKSHIGHCSILYYFLFVYGKYCPTMT